MKKNSMIEMQAEYQTPRVVEMTFCLEGPLCQSQFGSGSEDYGPDSDVPGIDF